MKFSAAVVAALCTAVLAAPAPAAPARNIAKNQGLSRRSRANRAHHFQHKRSSSHNFGHSAGHNSGLGNQTTGFGPESAPGDFSGPDGAAMDSSSGAASTAVSSLPSKSTASASTASEGDSSEDDWLNESWAGVVVQPGEGEIVGVSASFVLPSISIPTDGAQVNAKIHTASTWVGIDGYSCGSGLWQAGVDGNIDESGAVSWYAWYEWYPADTVVVDIGDLAVGDTIFVNVTASSTTKGAVFIENKSAGKSYTKVVTSTDKLCLADAEWIQEDLVVDGSDEGQANFGTITFSSATAYTKSGTLPPTSDTNLMDIEDSKDHQLTSTTYTDDSVIIKYL